MALLMTNHENTSAHLEKNRSTRSHLNLAVVMENLGDLCSISSRGAATRDQLIARLKNNCTYWKANDRDAKILVDQFLNIGRRQNLCYYSQRGKSQMWKMGPSPAKICGRRTIRTSNREVSNVVIKEAENATPPQKNSVGQNSNYGISAALREAFSANPPLEQAAVSLGKHRIDSPQPSTPPTSPVDVNSPPVLPIRRDDELSLPSTEKSASAPPKCRKCGGGCENSLVELYRKAQNFSYDLACFKPMFDQILFRRKLSDGTNSSTQNKLRNICIECNCATSRPSPSCRISKPYELDELLDMLAELNRRRILTEMSIKAEKEKSRARARDHRFHRNHHRQQFILTPHAIIPLTRQAKIDLMQSPAEMKRCPKKLKRKSSREKQQNYKPVNSLKTPKNTLESPTSINENYVVVPGKSSSDCRPSEKYMRVRTNS